MTMLKIGRLGRPCARMDSCPSLNNNTHTALLGFKPLIDPHLIPADVDSYFATKVTVPGTNVSVTERARLNSLGHISRAFCPRIPLSPLGGRLQGSRFKMLAQLDVCMCKYAQDGLLPLHPFPCVLAPDI